MKILYLCTFYHRAILFSQQVEQLIKRGYEVKVFNSARKNEEIAEKFKEIIKCNYVKHIECWNYIDRFLFYPRQWKIEKELIKNYDLSEFDMIHSHLLLSSGYTALRMKKKYGIPFIVSVRVTDLNGFIKLPLFKNMAIKIMREASGILFLSESHKNEFFIKVVPKKLKDMVENKSIVIGNCLEKYWEINTLQKPKIMNVKNQINVLSVAKIRPIKNLVTASKAIEVLNSYGIKANLTIVGEIQDQNEYKKLKKFHYVTILQFMTKESLKDIYQKNDIFLLPSKNETFGRVYIEAMSQGLPVIYTKGQGFDGYFRDGEVGYSVCANDEYEIANKIIEITKKYKEISERCIKNCKLFYEKNIIDKLESFYNKSFSEENN